MPGTCGNTKKEQFKNNIMERFAGICPAATTPEGFTGYVLDFGSKLLTNGGLFAIIFLILFVRQNYFNSKSIASVLIFVLIISAAFAILQYLYPDMNGFIIAGIGVSVGMAMFKDQFSTVFINNSSASLN